VPRSDQLDRLRRIADRLSDCHPIEDAEIASANLMAGALYALHRAADLDYDDSRSHPNPEASTREFRQTALNVDRHCPPERAWLSGFYLTSALLRMAALNERINKHAGTTGDIAAVRQLVNKIKHEPGAQMAQPWHLTLPDAVGALEALCKRLEDALSTDRPLNPFRESRARHRDFHPLRGSDCPTPVLRPWTRVAAL
jgi:hypothetical protein